jgi:hypothetical protein
MTDQDVTKSRNRYERKYDRRKAEVDAYSLNGTPMAKNKGMMPRGDRKSTDCCWAFVFLAFMCGMLGLSVYGYASPNGGLLLAPIDGNGRICGNPNDDTMKDYTNLFFDLSKGTDIQTLFLNSYCVSECPAKDEVSKCALLNDTTTCPTSTYQSNELLMWCYPTKPTGEVVSDNVQ